ncbi:transcriptional regulator with XRE-family HTH domain [Bartonella silvatica]|uniref:Transcriptional regulator with XRE-family HTH domain n=1 Tax=Bartonella silvatica TaxID=357760 RepID=A0ABV2HFE1_9HYPH
MRGRSQPVGGEMQSRNPQNGSLVDKFIGKKIHFRRNMLKMSQKILGQSLGVSFQQIQKYEKGLNRVSARQLKEIADIFKVPISFFYADILTKQQPPYHHDEIYRAERNICFLKNFAFS